MNQFFKQCFRCICETGLDFYPWSTIINHYQLTIYITMAPYCLDNSYSITIEVPRPTLGVVRPRSGRVQVRAQPGAGGHCCCCCCWTVFREPILMIKQMCLRSKDESTSNFQWKFCLENCELSFLQRFWVLGNDISMVKITCEAIAVNLLKLLNSGREDLMPQVMLLTSNDLWT